MMIYKKVNIFKKMFHYQTLSECDVKDLTPFMLILIDSCPNMNQLKGPTSLFFSASFLWNRRLYLLINSLKLHQLMIRKHETVLIRICNICINSENNRLFDLRCSHVHSVDNRDLLHVKNEISVFNGNVWFWCVFS